MGGSSSSEDEADYVLLRDVKVGFSKNDGGDADSADEINGGFTLCFWIYIDKCDSFPSEVLVQKHPDVASSVPFLLLDDKKRMKLFPILFLHEEASVPVNSLPLTEIQCASTEFEFPIQKWVHVGCEVTRDFLRLHVDGEIAGEKPLACSIDEDSHAEALKKIILAYPAENAGKIHGYIHGLDLLSPTADLKNHHVEDPPVLLCINHSSASEIDVDSDGVWSIVGGKASCRKSFSLDVLLLDAFDFVVLEHTELEVVASLVYADNEAVVENTADEEPPILASYDGIEYDSHDRPSMLNNGCASFRLKISQLSSKCENRLFRIKFDIPKFGRFPFLETLSPSIRCISRSKNLKAVSQTFRKPSHRTNGINHSPGLDESMETIPSIIREAKPGPSSKRVKLGNDVLRVDKEHMSRAWISYEDNNIQRTRMRPENHSVAENNSSTSDNTEATNPGPKTMMMRGISSPISDAVIFKYCLGDSAERCELLKEIAVSATNEQLANFADQVSLFSGCSHHRQQIIISKRLVEDGIQVWNSLPKKNNYVMWENLVFSINEHFLKIASSTRSLTEQDMECMRRMVGFEETVSQGDFERIWSWLYPVAFSVSQSGVNEMWNSSAVWIQGFITKEEAESAIEEAGSFVLRFPTSRSWPHPDAGNLVVTYVGKDNKIHHRLLSLDFVNRNDSSTAKSLQELLLLEPELSKLGRMIRGQ